MAGFRIEGDTSGNVVEVGAGKHLKVMQEVDAYTNGAYVGASRAMGEVDAGAITGVTVLRPKEVDADYRVRMSQDVILDEEVFNYAAQNTGKHAYANTTLTFVWSAGQLLSNGAGITTASTNAQVTTYAQFPITGTTTLAMDVETAFSSQPTTNSIIEWGIGNAGGTANAPTDGVFFRLTSAGLQGVATYNGTETSTGIFPLADGAGTWVYTDDKRYQFICYQSVVEAIFWVNDGTGAVLLGRIPLPSGQPRMSQSSAASAFFKHRILAGGAGAVLQARFGAYNVRQGGVQVSSTMSEGGNRAFGSYQGLSGGTMGSLASYVNSTNPTAAAPSNTALTANLPNGLGGQGAVIAAAAAATDGIWGSYQVPSGSTTVQGRRLVVRGVVVDAVNLGAAVATTATVLQFALAYGHTAVSLATAEATAAKAPRRVALGFMTWPIGAAIGQGPQNGPIVVDFGESPIYVNQSEFIALTAKFMAGTATPSQVINFTWTPIYGWE